ncbi:MAG TPA: CatB-related O-acetyltransferase [Solirubrobacteraceae bacterium]|nr:CatB-related O-acetyltransferase [Solirubrobacteraceae bacterium]
MSIGRHVYGPGPLTFQTFMPTARISVGSFCSISAEARIIAGSEHVTNRPSTYALGTLMFEPGSDNVREAVDRGPTEIGSDVWIGIRAIVLSGVLVGDGAIIGAGSVVSRTVPPFAIVAGNPARLLRYRFDEDVRRRLLALRWWDLSDRDIQAAREWFGGDVHAFLDKMERAHPPSGFSDLTRRVLAAVGGGPEG